MNEIITRLNEIEEKADALLCDARAGKERLASRFEQEKAEIDARYDRMEKEAVEQLGAQLRTEARIHLKEQQEQKEAAEKALDTKYQEQRQQLAEEILSRVIQ